MASRSFLSEESRLALNHITSFQLNISDAYLSMAFGYTDDLEVPHFIPFFEDQVEVKKEHARQFIRFLKSSGAKISLPLIKRPDIQTWETGKAAIKTALDLEKELDLLLKDLNTLAERNGEAGINDFLRVFLLKQKRNLSYLDYQLSYQQRVEEKAQEEAEAEAERQQQYSASKKPAKHSRKKT